MMFSKDKVEGPISKSQMSKLINLMLESKRAKEKYDAYKEELTKDLKDGEYIIPNVGKVIKCTYVKYLFNKNEFYNNHPNINLDDYQKEVVTTKLDIKNLSNV